MFLENRLCRIVWASFSRYNDVAGKDLQSKLCYNASEGRMILLENTSILDGLNDAQREAVTSTGGPLLILAGAGSGKTRVLTHRIAYLLEVEKVLPWQILAITFTNKAANEMKERLVNLIGPVANDMWVSTFHSACVRILRSHANEVGFNRNFVIYDTADRETMLKQCLKELDLIQNIILPGQLGRRSVMQKMN